MLLEKALRAAARLPVLGPHHLVVLGRVKCENVRIYPHARAGRREPTGPCSVGSGFADSKRPRGLLSTRGDGT